MLLVDHAAFGDLDVDLVAALVRRKQVFDARAALDRDEWRARGFAVSAAGSDGAGARRADQCVRVSALRFSPSAWQLLALDAAVGALAYALAMWLRFLDEGVPGTYAQRLLPWLIARRRWCRSAPAK